MKLTPTYSVFYKLEGISGYNTFVLQDDSENYVDDLGMIKDFTGTKKQAIKKFKEFIKENPKVECWVRQMGFKERGFGPNEKCDFTKIAEYKPISS